MQGLPHLFIVRRLGLANRKNALPAKNQAHNVERAGTCLAIWERLRSERFDPLALWRTVGGDMNLLRQLVRIFEEESRGMLKEIAVAAEAQDATGLGKIAHKLKGSLLQFAAPAAVRAATELENCAALNHLNQAAPLIAKLTAEADSLLQLLHTMISGPIAGVSEETGSE